jgi:hypothetical protein
MRSGKPPSRVIYKQRLRAVEGGSFGPAGPARLIDPATLAPIAPPVVRSKRQFDPTKPPRKHKSAAVLRHQRKAYEDKQSADKFAEIDRMYPRD